MNAGPRTYTLRLLELLAATHLALFLIGVCWAFGGNADWVRTPIALWGSAGMVLTGVGTFESRRGETTVPPTLLWSWPILALNALVALSCLTPGMKLMAFGQDTLALPVAVAWWRPSAAYPSLALNALWLFDGIYFSCLNIALLVKRRRTLRLLLAAAAANLAALAIFGTAQKLVGATGLYFGAFPSPQSLFFGPFVYDNHWGAFAVLMSGAVLGLTLRYGRGAQGKKFFQGPTPAGLVVLLLVGLAVPLSGARLCTALLGALLAAAALKGRPRVARSLRQAGFSARFALLGGVVGGVAAASALWFVAGKVIQARAATTHEQLAEMWAHGGIGSRRILYDDTWRMARQRPAFGWGMGSFPPIFRLFNTQESKIDRIPVVYHDAHSDWLQSLAELGGVGSLLLLAAVALPLIRSHQFLSATLPFCLLAGCLLVALYAGVEFPFGNVAVVLGWWFCFFSALQYARLTSLQGIEPPP